MLRIGICDMDADFVKKLLNMLEETLYQYGDWEAQVFEDSRDVVDAIDRGIFNCNLLFMDIFQKNESGVSVAKYVDERHVDTDIIFVTTSKEHVFECYRHHTFAYLLKPLKEHDITTEVKRYLAEMKLNPKYLNISNRGNVIRIPLDTILYIESNYRTVIVHTKNRSFEYYEKLDHLEEALKKDGFIRCHQSYLVAVDQITNYSGSILSVGQYAISVSRKYKESVRERLNTLEIAMAKEIAVTDSRQGQKTTYRNLDKHEQCYLTSGLFQNNDMEGALVCVRGAYVGNIVRIVPEQTILIGRDGTVADMVVNLPLVSRTHCTIIYHEQDNNYEIVDCSTNGTFVDGYIRLVKGDTYRLRPGTMLSFGDQNTVYRLG